MRRRDEYTTELFIERSIEVHGDKYGYEKVEYVNCKTKVSIRCKIHNTYFQQTPTKHLSGQGCKVCNKSGKSTAQKIFDYNFIELANKVHNFKYDYSKTVFKNSHKKVIVICKDHGNFEATPADHLRNGCRLCSKFARKTKEKFILDAEKVHGKDTYDYSKVEYLGNKIKVCIICNKHKKEFFQRPNNHLDGGLKHNKGQGCPECGDIISGDNNRGTLEEFINRSQLVHGGKFDYSKVDYKTNHTKVVIICKKHLHEFKQIPSDHWNGHGCKKCGHLESISPWRLSTFNKLCKDGKALFYVIKMYNNKESFVKIGITSKTVLERYEKDNKIVYNYKILKELQTDPSTVWKIELLNKRILKKFRYIPQQQFGGYTECFTLDCLPHIQYTLTNP